MNLALSEAGRRIIDAVIEAPVAWRTPGELAERLGWSLDQTLDEIAALDAEGWLEAWELIDGPVVTLSVAATASYGVRLVEVGHDETPRWVRQGDPDPPTLWATGLFRSERAATLELVADTRPGVEFAAIQAEELAGQQLDPAAEPGRKIPERFLRPTILIGGGLSPWPGPDQVQGEDCPACRLAHLPAQAYCLLCDRWGLDLETDPVPPTQRRRNRSIQPRAQHPQDHDRKIQGERWKRRQKRKERRKAQAKRIDSSSGRDSTCWMLPAAISI